MKANNSDQKARLIAMIHRGEMDFIDKISKDALFTTGRKLSRADVVSAILSAVAQLAVNGKNIQSEEELRQHIEEAIQANLKEQNKDAKEDVGRKA